MSIRLSKVVQRVGELLDDVSGDHWSPGEINSYALEAIRIIADKVPAAYTETGLITLVAGPKQSAPADARTVVDVTFAVSPADVRGRAVTRFDPATLASFKPDWSSATPGAVRQWAPDERDPKVFWVYPPATAGHKVEAVYPIAPPDTVVNDTLPLDSTWFPAVVDYCLGRAYSKDAEYAGETGRSAFHMTAFFSRFPQ